MMNSSEDEDEYSKEEEASEDRVDSKQEPLTPSKKVTWSDKLTAVKNISPQHHHPHHHHHQHSPRKSGAKVRLISFHPNTL